jgi:hypothetical protein
VFKNLTLKQLKYFISYSRQNSAFVLKLASDLKKAGADIWLDQMDIDPGVRWDDSIQEALKGSQGLLVFLSEDSVKSQNVMDEVSYAISQEKQIVPIILEHCEIPFRLARYQHIDFINDYDTALQQLVITIKGRPSATLKNNQESIRTNRVVEKQQKVISKKPDVLKIVPKITGLVLIILAVSISILNRCPSNAQYFIIYTLVGIGIAMILVKSAEKSKANIAVFNTVIALSGGVALPFILFFTNPIGSYKQDDCNQLSAYTSSTVFIHGKKGKQDWILRQKGFVIMDIHGERKKASINEIGQAFFQNLKVGDSVRLEIDFSEPYKSVYSDSVYVINQGSNIYLLVALQGLGKVSGTVLYNDNSLDGVLVKLEGNGEQLLDTTDTTGGYSFNIPEQLQKSSYEVWFSKKGFKTVSATAYPQTGEPLNMVMEKNN